MKILPNLLTVDYGRANFPYTVYRAFLFNPTILKVPKKHRAKYTILFGSSATGR